jgi:alpha-glucoside transport system substrate-binding protein
MSLRLTRSRRTAALAGALSATLAIAACGGGGGGDAGGGTGTIDCAPYEAFGDLNGKTVTVYTSIVAPEDQPHIDSYVPFEECTGATVQYEGDKAFEAQLLVRAKAGNPPDIAYIPQPGLLGQLVALNVVKPAPPEVAANVDKFFGEDWKNYGTVNGTFYAAPLGANVKSFVWYSPKEFTDKNLKAPTTLAELKTMSDTLAEGGRKPWCAGIGSGDATGWPATDWLEDFMLRLHGPDVYDQWVKHEIPFNDPRVAQALDAVGAYLKDAKYVNGGLGDVKSIASTTFQDAGLPILQGNCSLHRQASFYAANWPQGTTVAEDGQVFAFYLPAENADTKPVLGAGEFVAAFADRPEVKAFQLYLSTDVWANTKAKIHKDAGTSGWISANNGLNIAENVGSPIDKLSAEILQDPKAVFRFDGSDLMPAAIGSNAIWKQLTSWVTGQDTQTTLNNIEAAWPK